ncbi:hypothetical protein ACM66B_006634 [Microbotryomycetes sp. NB124-2]
MIVQGFNPVAQTRTSKEDLLKALAAELKREKARGVELAHEIETTEQQLNAKHEHLLLVESTCEQEFRKNEAILTSLRREVAKAREQLDGALSCGEVEAQQYLSLLELGGGVELDEKESSVKERLAEWRNKNEADRQAAVTNTEHARVDPTGSTVRQTRGHSQTYGSAPIVTPRSPHRDVKPTQSIGAEARTQEKLRRLDERVTRTLDFPTTRRQQQDQHEKVASTTTQDLQFSRVASDSEYDDSADQESLSRIVLGHDELHKRSGGKWKLFGAGGSSKRQ